MLERTRIFIFKTLGLLLPTSTVGVNIPHLCYVVASCMMFRGTWMHAAVSVLLSQRPATVTLQGLSIHLQWARRTQAAADRYQYG